MATRADHGEGSCRQVQTGKLAGRWRVQYTLEDTSGIKKRLSRIFPTQKEGKDFLRSLKRAEDSAAIHIAKELTFGEWFMWLAEHEWSDSLDPKTLRDRVSRYKKYAAKRWAGIPLTKIDPMDVCQRRSKSTEVCWSKSAELRRSNYAEIGGVRDRIPR
jgi:hypothetical protein